MFSWNNVYEYCTDGTLVIMSLRSGFQVLVQYRSPHINYTHCMMNLALALKNTFYLFRKNFRPINENF